MKASDIQKIFIIGAGTMAAHTSGQFALFGREVVAYAKTEEKGETFLKKVRNEVFAPLISAGFFSDAFADEAMKRIHYVAGSPSKVPQDVDLVSESVYEEYDVKEAVWKEFAPYLPKHAILTTDSSSLAASRFYKISGGPERFLSWHFYMPTYIRNVTDIFPMEETDSQYVEVLRELANELHLNPCLLKQETPGFLANNMLYAVINMGLTLYRTGAADFPDIDRAWMGVRQEKSGPFGVMDLSGIDTFLSIMRNWRLTTPENIAILEEKVAAGELGVKTGKGFYTYPDPLYKRSDFLARAAKIV